MFCYSQGIPIRRYASLNGRTQVLAICRNGRQGILILIFFRHQEESKFTVKGNKIFSRIGNHGKTPRRDDGKRNPIV
ncbi:hypothetical protein Barb6_00512 [Bacteroidales bacterium Barb6]|nr:hypothetical protein Barb6_00512 [Bacteroidales bacterium Barb6]